MATLYRPAKAELLTLIEDVMTRYHAPLASEEVTIGCLVAFCGDNETGPALKHGGYPAIAVISITPYKQRVQGLPDALIVVDGDRFSRLKPQEREAVIDHEIQHVELVEDEMGVVRRDDFDRPKLKLRLHDIQIGGFKSIIRRHGPHAIEYQQVRDAGELLRQQEFDWGDDQAGPREQDGPVIDVPAVITPRAPKASAAAGTHALGANPSPTPPALLGEPDGDDD